MNRSALFLLSLSAVVLISCKDGVYDIGDTISVVTEIVTDKTCPYHRVMSEASAVPEGGIHILGSEHMARYLCRKLRDCDMRDNVTGAYGADGLPDFAGETIISVIDTLNKLYHSPVSNGEKLREIVVRQALLAIDTVYHISPFDLDGRGVKASAKMIVLADPLLAQYGKSDIDTLFSCFGCGIPVVSPIDLMLSEIMARKGNVNIGIICEKGLEDVHFSRFEYFKGKYGASGSACSVFSVIDRKNPLKEFMDRYMDSGQSRPVDVVLVNTPYIRADNVKASIVDMVSLLSSDSVIYGRLLSDRFHILDAADAVTSACHSFLRSSNLFTHRVSMPLCEYYYVWKSGVLIQDSYVQN